MDPTGLSSKVRAFCGNYPIIKVATGSLKDLEKIAKDTVLARSKCDNVYLYNNFKGIKTYFKIRMYNLLTNENMKTYHAYNF